MNYPKNRFSKENPCQNKEWLYNQYITEDKSSQQIADEVGCKRPTVQMYLSRYKIKKDFVRRETKNKKPYQEKEYLIEQHFNNKKTVSEIAKENNVSVDTIIYFFKKNGIEYIPAVNKTTISDDEEIEIVNEYLDGLSSTEVGRKHNISHHTVLNVLKRHNVKSRGLSESQYNFLGKESPKELSDKDWLYDEYITNKRNSVEIAQMLNIDSSTVIRCLKRYNIPIRDRSESKIGVMSGDKHPNYKGGITPLNLLLREFFNTNIAPKVAKRDNYTCQKCGKTHTILHIHHIKHFSDIVKEILQEHPDLLPSNEEDKLKLYDIITHDERFLDTNNLITYCRDCHILEHTKNKDN